MFALAGAETPYRVLVESMAEGAAMLDADSRIIYANEALARMLKKPPGRLAGTKAAELAAPGDRPRLEALLRDAAATAGSLEFALATGDGAREPARVQASPLAGGGTARAALLVASLREREQNALTHAGLQDSERSRRALLSVLEDQQRAENLLRDSEARFRSLTEHASDLIVVIDRQGVVRYASPSVRQLGGYEPEEVLGQRFTAFMHPDDAPMALRNLMALVATPRGIHAAEFRYRCKDGRWIVLASRAQNALDDTAVQGIVLNAHDVTENKRFEQELRALNASLERRIAERTQQLEEASRAKSEFLANMSHELRTPLNAIIGFSEMLKDGTLGELGTKQRGFVTDIFEAGTHLLSLINDILDLSKVEAGSQQLELEAVDVAALLGASTLVVREKALAHRIRLDSQLDPALGPMPADERKLKQIVYNLLSNAVKFTPDGGAVTLRARRCTRTEVALDGAMPARLIALPPGEDAEFLAIAVEDNGIGIAEEHLPKLFEPFTQVDSSLTRRQRGTGLGLSLVRRLAQLHGGTVGVASRPGAGSRFCVWLPCRVCAARGGG